MSSTNTVSDYRKILIKGAHVLSLDATIGELPKADILVSGSVIEAIAPNLNVTDAIELDASNTIAMPGFVDTHRHLWEGLIRHALPDATLGDYMREVNGRFGPAYTAADVYAGTLLSALGAINSGVTCVLDWAQVQNSPEHSDASVQALQDAGIRAVFGYGFPTVSSGHAYPQDIRRLRRDKFASSDQLLTLALATNSPEMAPDAIVKSHWELARELDVRLTLHAGIEGACVAGEIERFGREGLLRSDTTYIHCATLNATEWRMIADTGGTVSIAAPIELQMGHGDPPIQQALDVGLRPSLSVDVEVSMSSDIFTQMRTVLGFQRGAIHRRSRTTHSELPRLITARDVLEFATLDGAHANGLSHKVGSLKPGNQADIILLRTDSINTLPFNSAVGAVVLSMDTSNVDTVMIAGRVRKQHGKLVNVDMRKLAALSRDRRDSVMAVSGFKDWVGGCH